MAFLCAKNKYTNKHSWRRVVTYASHSIVYKNAIMDTSESMLHFFPGNPLRKKSVRLGKGGSVLHLLGVFVT